MGNIELYRGFVVRNLKDITRRGLAIPNPKPNNNGEINWPGGLSFSRTDAFSIAEETAKDTHLIPVGAKISIPLEMLNEIPLLGIRRILDIREGDLPGAIHSWRCLTMDDINNAYEFTLPESFLTLKWITKMNAEICTQRDTYKSFSEFRREVEGSMSWIERTFKV